MKLIDLLKHITKNLENGVQDGTGLLHKGDSASNLSAVFLLDNQSDCELKPITHTVNGFDVPLPISEWPVVGAEYFVMKLGGDDLCHLITWSEQCHDASGLTFLRRGLMFATKGAAQQNALATLGHNPKTTMVGEV
jgi:hypothetical protein